jgi:hypothetical protein
MSGGAPVPVIVAEKILCIADLKEAGSKKLPQSARGEFKLVIGLEERGRGAVLASGSFHYRLDGTLTHPLMLT